MSRKIPGQLGFFTMTLEEHLIGRLLSNGQQASTLVSQARDINAKRQCQTRENGEVYENQ